MPKLRPISLESEEILRQAKYWTELLNAAVNSPEQLRGSVSLSTLRQTRQAAHALHQAIDEFQRELGPDPTAGHPDRSPARIAAVRIAADDGLLRQSIEETD